MKLWKEFAKGIFRENPVLVSLLGLCPVLAVTTSVKNGLGMGLATTFVLLGSNSVVSLLGRHIPDKVRIPSYIVVIATFVTMVDLFIQAFSPALNKSLGIFIPLIVVNCIVLGRAEAFAGRSGFLPSVMDALGMGLGFTLALLLLSSVREILGNGTFWGIHVLGNVKPVLIFILPPGAFIVLGFMVAGLRAVSARWGSK